ncbi:MAG: Rpn family recombination-promoting nuclease/putative transposase [Deltaproteobacteria bacterium]|nr:Rpn family recombination-promoting nuclease/putative transposase [Deltaproteobacteria bacterium]
MAMARLKYPLTNDMIFKKLFVRRQDLLKLFVAAVLKINVDGISEFAITNPEIPPAILGGKFCRLDINMAVDGKPVNLEVQVKDERDYRKRSLYYFSREYSSALGEGERYDELPQVAIISVLDFNLFDCDTYHSEFRVLEISRHEMLTDDMSLYYFELKKLPKLSKISEHINNLSDLDLFLALFRMKTEAQLKQLEALEVPIVTQTLETYHEITGSPEFRELARLRAEALHNEASALGHATEVERQKWQGVVADKDAKIADKDAKIADMAAENLRLRERLAALQND